jgi:hypothetical protein
MSFEFEQTLVDTNGDLVKCNLILEKMNIVK